MGGKRDAPDPPDYRGAAIEQGKANKEAAIASSMLSNPNIFTPYGSQQVSYAPGPDGNWIPTVNQQFSDTEQQKYDAETAAQLGLYDVGLAGLDRVGGTMSQQFQPGEDWQQYQTFNAPTGPSYNRRDIQSSMWANGMQNRTWNKPDRLTTSGLTDFGDYSVGGLEDYANAIRELGGYELGQERSNLEADLAARGFTPGTQGYDDALRAMGQKENDFYLQSLLSAGQEQDRINRGLMAQRGQEFGERGDVYQSQDRDWNRELQYRDWAHNINRDARRLEAQERQQDFQNKLFALSAQQSAARDAATVRQNQLQEAAYFRNQPLSELNSLIRGTPANLPQFQAFSGQTIQPPPMYQAAADRGAYDLQNYANQGPSFLGALGGGLLSAAGAAGGFKPLFGFGGL